MSTVAQPDGWTGLVERAGRMVRGVGWYVTSLMGDRAYDTYVAHHRSQHGEDLPLDERAFWVQRYRDQDANPGSRCC